MAASATHHRHPQVRRLSALSELAAGESLFSPKGDPGGPRVVMPGGHVVPLSAFGGGGGGFTGADRGSSSRGYVVFPTLDTSKEINPSNRQEVMRKARWLYNNDPFCKRTADGMARMLGWLMFQPATPDPAWNALAKRAAMDIAISPKRFDRAGKFNLFSYQLLLNRLLAKDGDSLSVPVLSDFGTTQMLCYEAHQVGSSVTAKDTAGWYDGVKVDAQGKHLKYRVLHGTDPKRFKDLNAGQAFLFARYERAGQNRGMSAFHSMVNDALDVREIGNDMGLSMKVRNLIGFYLGAREGVDEPKLKGAKGVQSALKQYQKSNVTDLEDVLGDEEDEYLSFEEVFAGGLMPTFEDFEPKVLESAQPHENEMAYLAWRIRRMSLGFDLAPELIWDIGNLNGNTQRWLAEDTQEMLESRRMETLVLFCQWWWFHVIGGLVAMGPDNGGLPEPKIPKHLEGHVGWWTVDWIPPKKKTIDRGREGKLNIDERRVCLRTLDEHFSEQQKDWNVEIGQWLDEIIAIKAMAEEKGLPKHEIDMIITNLLAPPAGTAISEGGGDGGKDDDTAPTEDED